MRGEGFAPSVRGVYETGTGNLEPDGATGAGEMGGVIVDAAADAVVIVVVAVAQLRLFSPRQNARSLHYDFHAGRLKAGRGNRNGNLTVPLQ